MLCIYIYIYTHIYIDIYICIYRLVLYWGVIYIYIYLLVLYWGVVGEKIMPNAERPTIIPGGHWWPYLRFRTKSQGCRLQGFGFEFKDFRFQGSQCPTAIYVPKTCTRIAGTEIQSIQFFLTQARTRNPLKPQPCDWSSNSRYVMMSGEFLFRLVPLRSACLRAHSASALVVSSLKCSRIFW